MIEVCADVRDPAFLSLVYICSFNEDKLPEWTAHGAGAARYSAARTDGMARKQSKP
jgi:hypothetical protein